MPEELDQTQEAKTPSVDVPEKPESFRVVLGAGARWHDFPPVDVPEKPESLRAEEYEAWLLSNMWLKQQTFFFPVRTEKAKLALSDKTRRVIYFLAHHHSSLFLEEPAEALPRHHAGLEEKEARERQIEILRTERDKFATQSQFLQSRVSELRRTAARETQRYDQLLADYSELQKQYAKLNDRIEKLIDCLNDRAKANDCLQSTLFSRMDGRLRMAESYEGVVEDVHGDKVLVVYDVNGKIIEQTYEKSQFLDGRLPDVATRLAVFVNVAEVQTKPVESGVEEKETQPRDDPAATRRKPLSGTIKF
jgi:hypothetical protein